MKKYIILIALVFLSASVFSAERVMKYPTGIGINVLGSDADLDDVADNGATTDKSLTTGGLTVTTGNNIIVGTTQWNSADELDGTKIKDADYGDVTIDAAGDWDVENAQTVTTEVDSVVAAINGIVKSDGTTISAASAGTDYQAAITGTDTHVMFFDGDNTPAGDAGMTYNKTTDTLTVTDIVVTDIYLTTNQGDIEFEGATADDFETTLTVEDPTTPDKTLTLPDFTGYVTANINKCTNLEGTLLAITNGVLNATEVDGSTTNEINTITTPDTEATEGLGITFADTGIITISESADTITFDATEADTLASVTGRGATTETASTFNGGITGTLTGSSTSCTGESATVATITGLAPDTQNTYARTQYLIPYASSTTAFGEIAIGDATQVLTSNVLALLQLFKLPQRVQVI